MYKDNNDLIELWSSLVKGIFNIVPLHNVSDPHTIYVDLNSALSILTTNELPQNDEDVLLILKNTSETIALFLEMWKDISFINIYYTFEPTREFNKYIPEWCNVRNTRIDMRINKLINTHIINRLKKLKINNINIIECKDSPILYIVNDIMINGNKGKDALIISRDPHYQCLFRFAQYVTIYDGKFSINYDTYHTIEGNKYPDIHYVLLPLYYTMVGMPRNDYSGIHKIGPYGAKKILERELENNYATLVSGEFLKEKYGEDVYSKLEVFNLINIVKNYHTDKLNNKENE